MDCQQVGFMEGYGSGGVRIDRPSLLAPPMSKIAGSRKVLLISGEFLCVILKKVLGDFHIILVELNPLYRRLWR